MKDDPRYNVATLRKYFVYLWPYRWHIVILVVFLVIDKLLVLVFPLLLGVLIDDVLVNRDLVKLVTVFLGMVVCNIFQSGLGALSSYVAAIVEQRIDFDIRWAFFSHILNMSLRFFDRRRVGELTHRMEDVTVIQGLLSGFLQGYGSDAIGLLVYGTCLAMINWKLMLVSFGTLPFFAASTNLFLPWLRSKEQARWSVEARVRSAVYEALSGIRVIKAFAVEHFIVRGIRHRALQQRQLRMEMQRVIAAKASLTSLLGGLGTYLTLGYGGYLIISGSLTLGELMAFYAVMFNVFGPAQRLISMRDRLQAVIIAADRFSQIFEEQPEVVESPHPVSLSHLRGDISFRGVSFGYNPVQPVLHDITLEVTAGTTVAFVGRSGAGKTTMINLVPRFYDVDKGEVRVDGVDVRDLDMRGLRRQIGMVSQDTFLFEGSVRENVAMSKRRTSPEEVERACKLARAHEFIIKLPDGYDTLIAERGITLSGGQKQRLAIARALLHDPRILILDEATSSVDLESETSIQAGLKELLKNRTTLVVAHRLSTIVSADMIVVINDGRIAETGTHQELLLHDGIYSKLYSNLGRV